MQNIFSNITILEISNNNIEELEDHIFVNLPCLVKLNAQRNKIKYLSGQIATCKKLHTVLLDQNMLYMLPCEMAQMSWLRVLKVSRN